MSAALLIQLAKEQLAQRQLAVIVQWVIIVAAIAVWIIPQIEQIFNVLLMLWGLVICLIYAIFAGWIMKISHLRKAMNFSNELFYNLWRIACVWCCHFPLLLRWWPLLDKVYNGTGQTSLGCLCQP